MNPALKNLSIALREHHRQEENINPHSMLARERSQMVSDAEWLLAQALEKLTRYETLYRVAALQEAIEAGHDPVIVEIDCCEKVFAFLSNKGQVWGRIALQDHIITPDDAAWLLHKKLRWRHDGLVNMMPDPEPDNSEEMALALEELGFL